MTPKIFICCYIYVQKAFRFNTFTPKMPFFLKINILLAFILNIKELLLFKNIRYFAGQLLASCRSVQLISRSIIIQQESSKPKLDSRCHHQKMNQDLVIKDLLVSHEVVCIRLRFSIDCFQLIFQFFFIYFI